MFKKISEWIEAKLGFDGLLHVLVCKLAVDACETVMPLALAVMVAAFLALYKEYVHDRLMGKGGFERKDLIADAAGIVLGLI